MLFQIILFEFQIICTPFFQELALGLFRKVYLFIFINNVCGYAFVYHFGENGWSWGAILLGSLLCQPHLVTLGAQWPLWVRDGERAHTGGKVKFLLQTQQLRGAQRLKPVVGWWGSAGSPQPPVQQACWGRRPSVLPLLTNTNC